MPNDPVQKTREALVRVINGSALVQAVTGRTTRNIVEWEPEATVVRPVVAYQFIDGPQLATDGDTRSMLFQISASADTDAQANELLYAVENSLTQSAFLALPVPLDAFVERSIRRGFDLDVTLRVSVPVSIAA